MGILRLVLNGLGARAACGLVDADSSTAGRVLGAFAIYYDKPRMPSLLEQNIIEQFTSIASIAIERAQNHAALLQSEARKAAILDSALDCIVTIDHEGRITEFNLAAERTFGYHRDDVVGKHIADIIIPRSLRQQHRMGFARYLATGEARVLGKRMEITAVRADGREFPVELAIIRIPMELPVILITGRPALLLRRSSPMDRDYYELLEKPLNGQELLTTVNRALRDSHPYQA